MTCGLFVVLSTTDYRWRDGYLTNNRPCYESGLDINRMTWLRKKKHFRRPLHIVCPSRWLAECVRDSRPSHPSPSFRIPSIFVAGNLLIKSSPVIWLVYLGFYFTLFTALKDRLTSRAWIYFFLHYPTSVKS